MDLENDPDYEPGVTNDIDMPLKPKPLPSAMPLLLWLSIREVLSFAGCLRTYFVRRDFLADQCTNWTSLIPWQCETDKTCPTRSHKGGISSLVTLIRTKSLRCKRREFLPTDIGIIEFEKRLTFSKIGWRWWDESGIDPHHRIQFHEL